MLNPAVPYLNLKYSVLKHVVESRPLPINFKKLKLDIRLCSYNLEQRAQQ